MTERPSASCGRGVGRLCGLRVAGVTARDPGGGHRRDDGGRVLAGSRANGVKLGLQRCKIIRVARPGQQVVAGDRLADRIGIGVLAAVFTPELVDRVVEQAGVRRQAQGTLPARGAVFLLPALAVFFNPSSPQGGDRLGAGRWQRGMGEQRLARRLLAGLQRGDLLLADRNFVSPALLAGVLAAGVHVLWRAKSDAGLPVLEVLADGTWLSRIADPAASRRMRRQGADPKAIPGITVRVIEYTVTSEDGAETSETFTLVTDILDPPLLTPQQAAAACACRWHLATCFDELETSIRGGAAVVLRSKSPPMIRQEIYAMLTCYQAIRTLLTHSAADAPLPPALIS